MRNNRRARQDQMGSVLTVMYSLVFCYTETAHVYILHQIPDQSPQPHYNSTSYTSTTSIYHFNFPKHTVGNLPMRIAQKWQTQPQCVAN